MLVTLSRPFDIVSAATAMHPETDVGVYLKPKVVVNTTLTADAEAGDTTIQVGFGGNYIVPGMLLGIGSELIAVGPTGIGLGGVALAGPLLYDHPAGTPVTTARGFVPGIMVFTKAGAPVGVITKFSITTTPTIMLGSMGSCGFYVSRMNPEARLLKPDRLVAFTFRASAGALWAGAIEVDDSSSSVINVMAPDVFSLLTQCPIVIDEEKPPNPVKANSVYRKIIDATNRQKTRDGEVKWDITNEGVTHLYYGPIGWDDDPFDALGDVAAASFTEFRWRAYIHGTTGFLRLSLVIADEFAYEGGIEIKDGPGGNVATNPRWVRDSAPIRNGLRVSGIAGAIGEYLPEWAQWAAGDVNPEATVYVDPGDYRRRVDRSLNVNFGISPAVLKGIADQILEELWAMYRHYLCAVHDRWGRINHEGWSYEGPPSDAEPFLHTLLGWRTRRRLTQIGSTPVSVVMVSNPEKQVLGVTYDRIKAIYRERRYWASEQEGNLYIPKMQIHGHALWFGGAEGGVLVDKHMGTFDHSQAIVSANAVTMPYRYDDDNGDGKTSYHLVRRVTALTEDGAVTEGAYFVMAKPKGPTTGGAFVRPTYGDAPYLRIRMIPAPKDMDFDPAFISKMYAPEKGRIRDWDPRRDGIGLWSQRTTIYNNKTTKRRRWNFVPFGVGVEGTTSLSTGISPTTTFIYVNSVYSLPRLRGFMLDGQWHKGWDGRIEVGSDPVAEIMVVRKITGNTLQVYRHQGGTKAIIHEAGTDVRALNVGNSSLFEHLWRNLDFKEGREWATLALKKLSQPFIRASIDVSNRDATWASVRIGSLHPLTLTTEGVDPLTGEFRCIGISPDTSTGRMEVILEWRP